MAEIAILHWDLTKRGGAEAIAINVIESLQNDHDLTLVTLRRPDWDSLNDYFNSQVKPIQVRRPKPVATVFDIVTPITDRFVAARFGLLQESLLCRFVRSIAEEFDLIVTTHGECCLDVPSIQYIHFPIFGLLGSENEVATEEFWSVESPTFGTVDGESAGRAMYNGLCRGISQFDPDKYDPTEIVTNSKWTSRVINELYGVTPKVVYPPVDTEGFDGHPWEERENGFVSLGRISPDKNLRRNVRIITQLREKGHDIHLHIVGPKAGTNYYRRIEEEVKRYDYIHLEGTLPRRELRKLLSRHKYALHGKNNEHFGMVVAEFLSAGMIPFVPNGGGQREIVGHKEALLYDSAAEGVEKIHRVLSDPVRQEALKPDVESIRNRFGRDRFKEEIKSVVRSGLE